MQVSDPDNQFVVVHNGIITNFKALKDFLVGFSNTDSFHPAPCLAVRSCLAVSPVPCLALALYILE